MSTQIILPRILQVGDGASQEAGNILNSLDCKRPLIVTDGMMVQLGYVARLQQSLEAASITADIFQDTVPEPTVSSIQAGVDKVRDGNYDSIIAIGIGLLAGIGGFEDPNWDGQIKLG